MSVLRIISVVMAVLFFCTSCSVNLLENFADKNTNESLFVDAKRHVDKGEYDLALEKIALMTGSFSSEDRVILLSASAYAGKCGLNFLDLVDGIENLGSTRFFVFLMQQFRGGTTAKWGYCQTAEDLVESLGATPALRTADENTLLALVSFAKLGTLLSQYADKDNNQTVDATFTSCTTTATGIPDAEVRQVGTAINIGLNSLVSSGLSLGSSSLSLITTACANLNSVAATYNFCDDGGAPAQPIYNPATFTTGAGSEISGIRSVIRDANVGLNSCASDGGTGASGAGCASVCL